MDLITRLYIMLIIILVWLTILVVIDAVIKDRKRKEADV